MRRSSRGGTGATRTPDPHSWQLSAMALCGRACVSEGQGEHGEEPPFDAPEHRRHSARSFASPSIFVRRACAAVRPRRLRRIWRTDTGREAAPKPLPFFK
jgi:hypothetical protein